MGQTRILIRPANRKTLRTAIALETRFSCSATRILSQLLRKPDTAFRDRFGRVLPDETSGSRSAAGWP